MSSKLGLILSMIFVAMFLLLGGDLICLQYVYNDLDAKSSLISYQISKNNALDSNFPTYVKNKYGVDFKCLSNCAPVFGDEVEYIISYDYQPLVISKETMTLSIKRSTIVGFYG